MIALNLTLLVQMGLFLVFLLGVNRLVYRPLLRRMDERAAKVEGDLAAAESDTKERQRLEALYKDRLTTAHQAAAQTLQKARYDAYQQNRGTLGEAKKRAEGEISQHRTGLDAQLDAERGKFPELLPGIISAIDRQVNTEGSLL